MKYYMDGPERKVLGTTKSSINVRYKIVLYEYSTISFNWVSFNWVLIELIWTIFSIFSILKQLTDACFNNTKDLVDIVLLKIFCNCSGIRQPNLEIFRNY